METVNSRVETRETHTAIRPATTNPWEAVVRAVASACRQLMAEEWLIELLALALVLFLIGATAVYGLALVSTWVPTGHSLTVNRSIDSDHEAEAGAIEANRREEGIRWNPTGEPR